MYDFRLNINYLLALVPRQVASLLFIVAVSTLSACGAKQVVVKDSFPAPVYAQHPQHVGLYLDEAFSNYTHAQKLPSGDDWNIDIGTANVALFQQILAGMFAQVTSVQGIAGNSGLDAVIQPEIEQYQFNTPEQNQTDYFEAWFKYRITLYDAQGKKLADWPLTAYGRSEAQFMGAEDSLRLATRIAMRDAATAMVLEFSQNPAVRALLYAPALNPNGSPGTSSTLSTQGEGQGAN